jgi:hypothetical protein
MSSKGEIKDFVKEVYATYNQIILLEDEKPTFRAWYALLHDLDISDIRKAFLNLATYETFMPRPGDVRRRTIDMQQNICQQLDVYEAWSIFQSVIKNANSGLQTEIDRRPDECLALRKTIKTFGESAFSMHTNGDREAFIRVYEKTAKDIDEERYSVPELPPEPPAEKEEAPAEKEDAGKPARIKRTVR